jgi:hypothetical protein
VAQLEELTRGATIRGILPLREHNVAVSLYPGLVRTESVLRAADHFDLSTSEWSLRQHW